MGVDAQHRARQSAELNIRLSAAVLASARRVAAARGETVSKLVRTAMIRTINESTVTPEHGLIGTHKVLHAIFGHRA